MQLFVATQVTSLGMSTHLLKTQELDHTEGDSGVEAQATLVRTNSAAELWGAEGRGVQGQQQG
jgi:hypothetical protein